MIKQLYKINYVVLSYRIFLLHLVIRMINRRIHDVSCKKLFTLSAASLALSYLHQLNIVTRFIATGHASFSLRTGFFKLGEKRRACIRDGRVRRCRPQLPPKQRGSDLRLYQRNSESLWCKRLLQCKSYGTLSPLEVDNARTCASSFIFTHDYLCLQFIKLDNLYHSVTFTF